MWDSGPPVMRVRCPAIHKPLLAPLRCNSPPILLIHPTVMTITMKKTIITLTLFLLTAVVTHAQEMKIGYFSYKAVLQSMPAYTTATVSMDKLRKQYADELEGAQKEFNEKYELFLGQQAQLAESIRQKRQSDLQALLERNEQFKKESERLLAQAEKEVMAPLHEKIRNAIATLGRQGGYAVIVNTDSEACPFISPALAVDVTPTLLDLTK